MRVRSRFPRRELLFQRLVLIYQMPKIGSQTIEATLRQCSFPHPIYRFHYLSRAFAKTLRRGLSSSTPDPAWKRDARQQLDSIRAMSQVVRLRRLLCLCGCRIPKLQVITGVRELISLVAASIFENYLYFAPNLESMTVDTCREALLHPKTFKTLRDWFDLELKSSLGIDVFKTRFPCEKGYAVFENRFARVLVYRYEALPRLPVLLKEFLDYEIPELVNCNLGESKPYAQQYRFVKEHLRLPADFVTALYDCKMMRHFYLDEERQNWRAKWTAPHRDKLAGETPALPVSEAGIV
jgi:hypothetical protein